MDLAQLNEALAASRARLEERDRLTGRVAALTQELDVLESRLDAHEAVVAREQEDVDRLEGLSLRSLFSTLLGDHTERLREERRELLAATLKRDESALAVGTLRADLDEVRARLAPLEDARAAHDALLVAKQEWLADHRREEAAPLFGLAEEEGRLQEEQREVVEALQAGEEALEALYEALASLDKAKGWGTFDLVGGGLISSMVKHSHMDHARGEVERAQAALRRFGRELADVGARGGLTVELGSFESFADLFFDNLITDWMVQSKIGRARDGVADAQRDVRDRCATLRARLEEVRRRRAEVQDERQRQLETWR